MAGRTEIERDATFGRQAELLRAIDKHRDTLTRPPSRGVTVAEIPAHEASVGDFLLRKANRLAPPEWIVEAGPRRLTLEQRDSHGLGHERFHRTRAEVEGGAFEIWRPESIPTAGPSISAEKQ